jgi:hypothetical protein
MLRHAQVYGCGHMSTTIMEITATDLPDRPVLHDLALCSRIADCAKDAQPGAPSRSPLVGPVTGPQNRQTCGKACPAPAQQCSCMLAGVEDNPQEFSAATIKGVQGRRGCATNLAMRGVSEAI